MLDEYIEPDPNDMEGLVISLTNGKDLLQQHQTCEARELSVEVWNILATNKCDDKRREGESLYNGHNIPLFIF